MASDQLDTYIDETWPGDEKRAKRREALATRLDVFLSDFRASEDRGGGWPNITTEEMVELLDIFGEIIDLKFERDCDGDRAIQYVATYRKAHRLHYVLSPVRLDMDAPDEDWNRYVNDQLQAIDYLSGVASEQARVLNGEIRHRNEKRAYEQRYAAALAAFAEFIKTADFPTGKAEYDRLNTLYPRSSDLFTIYARHYINSDAIEGRTEMLEAIPTADLDALARLRPRIVEMVNTCGKDITRRVWREYNKRLGVLLPKGEEHAEARYIQPPFNNGITE